MAILKYMLKGTSSLTKSKLTNRVLVNGFEAGYTFCIQILSKYRQHVVDGYSPMSNFNLVNFWSTISNEYTIYLVVQPGYREKNTQYKMTLCI